MRKFVKMFTLVAVVATLAVPQLALAQSNITTGQVHGEAKDSNGGALPGVTIQASNVDTGLTRRAVADADGFYRLDRLPPGNYDIRCDLSGFRSEIKRGVRVGLGSSVKMSFIIQPSAIEEEIVVTAEAPVIETTNPSVAMTISDEAIANLPLQGRDFSDFAILAPGTATADGSQQSSRGGLHMGARAIQNSFNIDGSNNQSSFFGEERGGTRPPFTFSQAAIKEFQVIKSSYNLQFNSSGGVINAITKSGTNTLAGQIFAYYTDDSMRSDDGKGREATTSEQTQFGFALGGPLVKDSLHFFVAYDGQRFETPLFVEFKNINDVVGDGNLFPTEAAAIAEWEARTGLNWETETGELGVTNDADVFLIKFDWQASNSHLATARVNYSTQESANGTLPFSNIGRSNQGLEENTFQSWVFSLNSVLSEDLFNEAILQYSAEKRPRTANNTTLPETGIRGFAADFGQQDFLQGNNLDENRTQIIDNLSFYMGDHTLKAGLNFDLVEFDNVFYRYSRGQYTFHDWEGFFNDEPRSFQQAFSDFEGRIAFDVDYYALYVQDEWRVNSDVTVTFGLRYDLQDNPTPDVANPAYPDTANIPDDSNNFAPRIGFAWDLGGDGKSVLRGGIGYFYDTTPTLILSNAMNDNGLRTTTIYSRCDFGDPCPDSYPLIWDSLADVGGDTGGSTPSIKVMDPDFENAETWRISMGYEREVFTDFSMGVDLIYSETDKLERSQNQNVSADGGLTADGEPTYVEGENFANFGQINQYTSDVEAEYTAFIIKARKRYSNGWMLDASYTWSDAKDSNSNERSTTSYPWDQYNLDSSWGPSNFNTEHKFVVSGSYSLPWDLLVSGVLYYRSGFPYTGLMAIDSNGDGEDEEPVLFADGTRLGRNTFDQPNFKTLDFRLSKAVRFGRSLAVEFIFDAFNVFNEDNWYTDETELMDWNGEINADFGELNQVGEPRSFQLGAKFTF